MKTIRITIDEALLIKVDQAARLKRISRSQFICKALEDFIQQRTAEELEQNQAEGYLRQPVISGEFDVWKSEQPWG